MDNVCCLSRKITKKKKKKKKKKMFKPTIYQNTTLWNQLRGDWCWKLTINGEF